MAANYWIKLYIEILDDPKIATLPDRLWRRIIELFMCAGRLGGTGELPETNQLAWILRMNTDDLQLDLMQIEATGIIQRTTTGWAVVNFAKRQAAVAVDERMKQYRERRQKEQYGYENVTRQLRNVTQINRLTDTDTDTDINVNAVNGAPADIIKVWMELTSMPDFPAKSRDDDIRRLRVIIDQHGDQAPAYLKKFWNAWINRKYSRSNTAWLDWALANEIPQQRKANNGNNFTRSNGKNNNERKETALEYVERNRRELAELELEEAHPDANPGEWLPEV